MVALVPVLRLLAVALALLLAIPLLFIETAQLFAMLAVRHPIKTARRAYLMLRASPWRFGIYEP